jgi:dTDP-4-dehydrorhamnose reductase
VSSSDIEIWASPEPTIARLDATTYRDQCEETGHARRESDIERLAALGVSASRYPVLWEHVERNGPGARDYSWAQRRLALLAEHGIEPLVTLLHHGSGPPHTELLDDAFPELFAAYAAETARRFPWVKRWTPINEPLTTARFSTLYGVWYPSARDHRAFGRAMLNQARAILLGFARIAAIVPAAQLMLTEDLQGYVAGDLAAQAYVAHKRERAYLSLDLLCGNVRPGHALYAYLVRDCGLAPRELDRLRRLARPPDLMGWNYYPNSERYVSSSPEGPYFANVALVDVAPEQLDPRGLLRAAWQRYRLPMALSEVHVIGTEDERVRWLLQRYDDVVALRGEGVDLRALGAWAAFGMVDWNSLLRERAGSKEDGIYTCASGDAEPAWTLAADALRSLAAGRRASLASRPGWWEQRRSA